MDIIFEKSGFLYVAEYSALHHISSRGQKSSEVQNFDFTLPFRVFLEVPFLESIEKETIISLLPWSWMLILPNFNPVCLYSGR